MALFSIPMSLFAQVSAMVAFAILALPVQAQSVPTQRIGHSSVLQSPGQIGQSAESGFEIEFDQQFQSQSAGTPHPVATGRQSWSVESVLNQLDIEQSNQGQISASAWWTPHVTQPVNSQGTPVQLNVGDLMLMALEHSAKVNVARALPFIRETAVVGAEAKFDWNQYIDARWTDTSEPVGNILTVGAGRDRFREHDFTIDAGLRKTLFSGADFYTYHRMGHVNSNSTFFDPNNQATSRIVLGFTQPLLKGRGEVYNTSLILLAQIDTGSATDEFHRQLQSHLLEVARGYWALYLERANLAQKVSLFLKTNEITAQLNSRSNIDAKRSQVTSANAALESRKSDLIRARAGVKNAETRLRALINAPMLSDADMIEMIPAEHPTTVYYPAELHVEFETALQNRPELHSAMKAIRAACVRLNMSDHEILPTLNLVTEAYVSGLRGDSDISNAWLDQFRQGEPSYSFGLQYEVPIGRRASFANQRRRQVEVRQLEEQYRATLELVRAEVEVAVRELQTSHKELNAKHRSWSAAVAESETLTARWNELGDQGGTGGLLLESLLRAQERVNQFEYEFAKAQMTYNLALINMRHANGTLYQTHAAPQPHMANGHPMMNPALAPPGMQQHPNTQLVPQVTNSTGANYPLQNSRASAGNQLPQGNMVPPQKTVRPIANHQYQHQQAARPDSVVSTSSILPSTQMAKARGQYPVQNFQGATHHQVPARNHAPMRHQPHRGQSAFRYPIQQVQNQAVRGLDPTGTFQVQVQQSRPAGGIPANQTQSRQANGSINQTNSGHLRR